MQGTITGSLDVAQVVLYVFWVFAAGLIFYLRREDKREGYPLESERSAHVRVQGFPWIPEPKTFLLPHGGMVSAPRDRLDTREIRAEPVTSAPGAPLEPQGDPLADGVGPAAYANRADAPELTIDGHPAIVPLRVATDHVVADEDLAIDPRGMEVSVPTACLQAWLATCGSTVPSRRSATSRWHWRALAPSCCRSPWRRSTIADRSS